MSSDLNSRLNGGIDPWSRIAIDAATRSMAEQAAARAGLSIEEWLERAIRRTSLAPDHADAPNGLDTAAQAQPEGGESDRIIMPDALLTPLLDEEPEEEEGYDTPKAESALRKPYYRWAAMVVGAALAIAAGVVSAQYLIPERATAIHVALAPPAPVETAVPPPPVESAVPSAQNAPAPPPQAASLETSPANAAQPETPETPRIDNSPAAPAAPSQAAAPAETAPSAAAASEKPPAAARKSLAARPAPAPAAKPSPKTAKAESAEPPSDPRRLAPWLEAHAKNGDAVATYRLGVLYALGEGVTQDYQRAASLFKTAAEDGVTEAQYNIAVMYAEGLGIDRDPTQAVFWYRKAAAQGSSSAAFNLGVAYSNGIGVKQSMEEAARWFREAGEAGVVNAQFNLGLLYERGEGLAASPVEAYAWYAAAAARGDSGAAQRRDRLAKTLSPAVLKDAQARAEQLQASIQTSAISTPAAAIGAPPTRKP